MTELKTLKDLEHQYHETDSTTEYPMIAVEDLRQEAIKWAKFIESNPYSLIHMTCTDKVSFIKHFFNLTDEELK